MTGACLVATRERLGVSTVDVARILLVNYSTVYRWERQEIVKAESLQRLAIDQLYGLSMHRHAAKYGDELKLAIGDPPGYAMFVLLDLVFRKRKDWKCPTP